MKENNGQIIIEVNDCVQVIKGKDIGTLGIVISTQGNELLCWSRPPTSVPGGSMSFTFKTESYQCMCIGKGRIKPSPKGEKQKTLEQAQQQAVAAKPPTMPQSASRASSGVQPPPEPRKAREQPRENPQPEPVKPPAQQPAPASGIPEFGAADADQLDLRPKPTLGEDVEPELLKPATFSGPNARELHGRPAHPEALRGPEQEPQIQGDDDEGAAEPRPQEPVVNPPKVKKAKKVSVRRKVRKGSRRGKPRRGSLGLPMEGQGTVPGGSKVRQDGGEGQAGDSPLRSLPIG